MSNMTGRQFFRHVKTIVTFIKSLFFFLLVDTKLDSITPAWHNMTPETFHYTFCACWQLPGKAKCYTMSPKELFIEHMQRCNRKNLKRSGKHRNLKVTTMSYTAPWRGNFYNRQHYIWACIGRFKCTYMSSFFAQTLSDLSHVVHHFSAFISPGDPLKNNSKENMLCTAF